MTPAPLKPKRGRPRMSAAEPVILAVRVPPELADAVHAEAEGFVYGDGERLGRTVWKSASKRARTPVGGKQ